MGGAQPYTMENEQSGKSKEGRGALRNRARTHTHTTVSTVNRPTQSVLFPQRATTTRRGSAHKSNAPSTASSLGGRTLARVKKKWRVGRTAGCYGVCEAAARGAAAAPPQRSVRLAHPSLAATYRRRPPTSNRRVVSGRRPSIARPIRVSTGAPFDVTSGQPARFEAARREPADGCLQRHLGGASCPPTQPPNN